MDSSNNLQPKDSNSIKVYCQNDLVNLNQSFSQSQLDILFYLLHIVEDDKEEYSFPIKELSLISGKDINCDELNKLCKKLLVGSMSVVDENDMWLHYNLFHLFSYNKGIVTVVLGKETVHLFKRVQNSFTQFELQSALRLSSKYSKRLYWLLSEWKTLGEKTYRIVEFKRLMGFEYEDRDKKKIISSYNHLGSLKRVVEKCCEEISLNTDLIVKTRWDKDVRSFSKITFTVQIKKNIEVISFKDSPAVLALLKATSSHKFSEEEARIMISKGLTLEIFNNVIKRILNRFQKNPEELGNANAYIRECLIRDGFLPKEKVSVTKVITKRQREKFLAQRVEVIDNIKIAMTYGTPKEAFIDKIEKFDIKDEELGIVKSAN